MGKNEPDNTFSDYGYYVRFNENAKMLHGRSIHLVAAKRILIMYFYVSGEIILLLEMMD